MDVYLLGTASVAVLTGLVGSRTASCRGGASHGYPDNG
jgi:hypothetical protein